MDAKHSRQKALKLISVLIDRDWAQGEIDEALQVLSETELDLYTDEVMARLKTYLMHRPLSPAFLSP